MIRAGALLAAVLALASGSAAATFVDFLHVESNVGGSTGGHFAVRLGPEVFHYQNRGGGTLRLVREDFDFFRYVYSVLENRSIHASRVRVEDDTGRRLRDRFASRLLVEEGHFAAWAALRDDVTWLEARPEAAPTLRVTGAGFFEASDQALPVLVALRERIERERSAGFLEQRARRVDAARDALAPDLSQTSAIPASPDRLPRVPYTFTRRLADLAAQRLALDVLRGSFRLRDMWLRRSDDAELALDDAERAALRDLAERLDAQLASLAASARPDWGAPLLLGMARRVALDASLREGRLVVLDALPAEARVLPGADSATRAAFLQELRDDARVTLRETRARLVTGTRVGEREYSDLEDAANRYLEVLLGIETAGDLRMSSERLVPHGTGPLPDALRPALSDAARRDALPAARARLQGEERTIASLYGYHLVRHNCVTEIFAAIHAELRETGSRERLGGSIDPHGGLAFLPFLALREVDRSYRVAERYEIPSLRRRRLTEMYAREQPLRVYLREANTLTSSVYRPGSSDTFFLLFTDDVGAPLRPLYGAINLAAGLGESFLGVLRLPFDGGRGLLSGLEGAVFSLPELAFVSLRKGSLEYGRSAAEAP